MLNARGCLAHRFKIHLHGNGSVEAESKAESVRAEDRCGDAVPTDRFRLWLVGGFSLPFDRCDWFPTECRVFLRPDTGSCLCCDGSFLHPGRFDELQELVAAWIDGGCRAGQLDEVVGFSQRDGDAQHPPTLGG